MPLDFTPHKPARCKVTLTLPANLVESTKQASTTNFSETVEKALRDMLHRQACQELRKLRGKVKPIIPWQELRAMDDE